MAQQLPQFVGDLQVVSLERITQDDADPHTFKLNMLVHGAENWALNARYLDRIGNLASAGAVLFGVQVAVWVLRG